MLSPIEEQTFQLFLASAAVASGRLKLDQIALRAIENVAKSIFSMIHLVPSLMSSPLVSRLFRCDIKGRALWHSGV